MRWRRYSVRRACAKVGAMRKSYFGTSSAGAILFALASQAFAQTVWVVGPPGTPEADFALMTPAIAQAEPGDTILVRAGDYVEPAALVIDKPVSILADSGATYRGPTGGDLFTHLTIRDIPAGTSCTVQGMRSIVNVFGSEFGGQVVVENCEGLVHLRALDGAPGSIETPGGRAVYIRVSDSAQFQIHDVSGLSADIEIIRSSGSFNQQFSRGSRYQIEESTVHFDRCDLGMDGVFFALGLLFLERSSVSVSRSIIAGEGVFGGPGAIGTDSTITLDPSTTLTGMPPVSGASLTQVDATLTTLTASLDGSDLIADLQGDVGENFATLLAFPGTVLPTPFGDLWVHPDQHLVLDSGVLAARERQVTLPLAAGIPLGLEVVLQAVTLGTEIRISNGVGITIP